MNHFYIKTILFWFILLIVALFNALIREVTYKPFLEPVIGMWAHQLSSLTGIILFFILIFLFLKNTKNPYTKNDLYKAGIIWITLTLIFETWMNLFIRNLTIDKILETYYFWNGETWIFVLISLIISPQICYLLIKNKINKKQKK
jgi:hypothetical protein